MLLILRRHRSEISFPLEMSFGNVVGRLGPSSCPPNLSFIAAKYVETRHIFAFITHTHTHAIIPPPDSVPSRLLKKQAVVLLLLHKLNPVTPLTCHAVYSFLTTSSPIRSQSFLILHISYRTVLRLISASNNRL